MAAASATASATRRPRGTTTAPARRRGRRGRGWWWSSCGTSLGVGDGSGRARDGGGRALSGSVRWPVSVRNTSSRLGSRTVRPAGSMPSASRVRSTATSDARAVLDGDLELSPADADLRAGRAVQDLAPPAAPRRRRRGRGGSTVPPSWDLSSAGVPSAITRPRSITAMRSARRSASSRYWVVSRTVVPSATSSSMTCHRSDRLAGSRPVVGSSRNSTGGRWTRAAARSSRRRMPPE